MAPTTTYSPGPTRRNNREVLYFTAVLTARRLATAGNVRSARSRSGNGSWPTCMMRQTDARARGRDPMAVSRADVQELSDQILEHLGVRIRSGQMVIHFNDGLVQRVETRTVHRLRTPADRAPSGDGRPG